MLPTTLTPYSPKLDCTGYTHQDYETCTILNKRRQSARAYFVIGCINFAYVVVTTTLFVYRARVLDHSKKNKKQEILQQEIQRRPLRQRGLFGTIMSSIGHLLFSTSMLLFQAFYTTTSCDVLLWGTLIGMCTWTFSICWCSYRLHILLRLSVLKQRFLDRSKRVESDPQYRWFMRHRNFATLSVGNALALYTIILVVIVTICAISEASYTPEKRCRFSWANYLLLCCLAVLFVFVFPGIWWRLRNHRDMHGIRTEILVLCSFGVPCIIMYMVWSGVFEPPYSEAPSATRTLFAPGNWAVIMTSVGHILLVVLPLIRSYRTKKSYSVHDLEMVSIYNIYNNDSDDDDDDEDDDLDSLEDDALSNTLEPRRKRRRQRPSNIRRNAGLELPRLPGTRAHYDLTADSLDQALQDPDAIKSLKALATEDFSVENVLFYEEYLKLRRKIAHSQNKGKRVISKYTATPGVVTTPPVADKLYMASNRKSSSRTASFASVSMNDDGEEEQTLVHRQQQSSRGVPPNCIADCIGLYQTFIPDSAPLQVNITAKARKSIEAGFIQSTSTTTISSNSTSADENNNTNNVNTISINEAFFTLDIFEKARSEVFWNIFTSVFPKFVNL